MRELELAIKRDIYKGSYYEYFKWAFKIIHPFEELSDNFHIEYLCGELQKEVERIIRGEDKNEDFIINIPPRTSKSLITSVIFLTWVWILKPELKFLTISFDKQLALLNSSLSKDIINSEEYQELFGHIFRIREDSDSKEFFANDKGGYRLSKTTGSNITGFSGGIIILDDPQSAANSDSDIKRKEAVDYYNKALYNRLTPVNIGLRIVVQQRLHEDDLSGVLLKNDEENVKIGKAPLYRHICLPAEILEGEESRVKPKELEKYYTDGLLDPNRLNRKTLSSMLSTLSLKDYNGQYGQRPAAQGGNLIDPSWFDEVDPSTLERDFEKEPIMFFIDGAYTEKTINDPSCIMCCYKRNNQIFVLDITTVRKSFPEFILFLKEYILRWRYSSSSIIYVEPKATGLSIIQQILYDTNLNIVAAKNPTRDKTQRVNSYSPIWRSRRVKFVNGYYIGPTKEELELFPNATHDDRVDVIGMATEELLISSGPDFIFL